MTQEQTDSLVKMLLGFIEYVTKNPGTEAEIAALPEVARVLVEITKD